MTYPFFYDFEHFLLSCKYPIAAFQARFSQGQLLRAQIQPAALSVTEPRSDKEPLRAGDAFFFPTLPPSQNGNGEIHFVEF